MFKNGQFIGLFALLVLSIGGVNAEKKAEKGKVALTKALAYVNSSESLAMIFKTKTYWEAMEEWQTASGKLWVSGKKKFRLFLEDLEVLSDGEKYWQYSIENKQVVLEDAKNQGAGKRPSDVLLGFLQCKALGQKRSGTGKSSLLEIELEPSKTLDNYDSLRVYLDPKTFSPKKVYTVDKAHNVMWYILTEIRTGVKFNKDDFTFVLPKDVELIDMRD